MKKLVLSANLLIQIILSSLVDAFRLLIFTKIKTRKDFLFLPSARITNRITVGYTGVTVGVLKLQMQLSGWEESPYRSSAVVILMAIAVAMRINTRLPQHILTVLPMESISWIFLFTAMLKKVKIIGGKGSQTNPRTVTVRDIRAYAYVAIEAEL